MSAGQEGLVTQRRGGAGPRWWPEIALLVAGYLLYRQVRAAMPGCVGAAQHNAGLLVDSTPAPVRHLELLANQVTTSHDALASGTAVFYITLHLPVTAAVLVWLWCAHQDHYRVGRDTLGVVSLIGLVGFWVFPVTPPRLYLRGLTDTVGELQQSWGIGLGQPGGFVNDHAAFPSLHLAWACWCAWAVQRVRRTQVRPDGRGRVFARRALWVYPIATGVVLVATANHYLWDLVAGVLAFVVARVVVAVAWRRRRSSSTGSTSRAVGDPS